MHSWCRWYRWSRETVAAVAILFTVLSLRSVRAADPTSAPGEIAEGVFGEGASGYGRPDSNTGAMTWTYPFRLPAARGGPQPQLTLGYNSSSRDREAGYGWGLSLPVIERKPLSGNPCFTNEGQPIACGEQRKDSSGALLSEERYTFNGQPLVFICRPPGSQTINDPDCGNEPQPNWSLGSGWRYFRLQVEGQFARFYLSKDRRHWKVQLKGGELLEFGEPPNSGLPAVEHAFENKNAVFRWRLIRHSDAVHKVAGIPVNYVDYRWKQLGKRGLLYLTDVYDTPRAGGHVSDADFAHHTQLNWEPPDFPQTFYADPYRATPDLRLTRVAVASMPWSGKGPREVIRAYGLRYAPAQGTTSSVALSQVFQLWNHSFLVEIAMEGRCNRFENGDGSMPQDPTCASDDPNGASGKIPRLPSTTFEYEDGNPAFGLPRITKVEGGPPNAVDDNRVLPYVKSVGIVDFNRDGLPDVVQGWNTQFCLGEGEDEDAIHESIKVNPNQDFLECQYKTVLPQPTTQNFQSTRPITAYLNRGIDLHVNLSYQCMDAGTIGDATGLTHYNVGRTPSFFAGSGGTTLVVPWSEGVVAWGNAQWATYRAVPLLPGFKPDQFAPGSGCDADQFKLSQFKPGWKWEKTQSGVDWAKPLTSDPDLSKAPTYPAPAGGSGPFGARAPRWFTDIDGDGLVDRLVDTGTRAMDFNVANVEFTRRYGKNDPRPIPGSGSVQIPFAFDPSNFTSDSLAPSAEARKDTKFFYVDINGDGLVDLVTQNPNDNGGIPRVRPGDGHGHFLCRDSLQPWPCEVAPTEPADFYQIAGTGARLPWPFTDDTFFQDVTGDGLADIIQYDKSVGEVRVWVNQDGHLFACTTPSCVAGNVLDFRTGSADIGEHRTTFADMDADGVSDIVIIARQGVYVGLFMKKSVLAVPSPRGAAPRPGLLTRIHNGFGATTDIRYRTVQSLDIEVRNTPLAWQYHSPVSENVVTQTITQDSFHAGGDPTAKQLFNPYRFERKRQYFYMDPAYDRWSRTLAGFRKVVTRSGDETAQTATTYWFGPCQNNGLNARLPSAPNSPLCGEGSYDDINKPVTGRAVRVDRGNLGLFPKGGEWGGRVFDGKPGHLWTKTFGYANTAVLFDRDRRVTFSYPAQIDTFLYDDAQPVNAGATHPASGEAAGGDPKSDAPQQKGIRKHLRSRVEYDNWGTLKKVTDSGAVKDEPGDIADATTVTLYSAQTPLNPNGPSGPVNPPALLPCSSDWQCLPDYISVWEPAPGGAPSRLLRKTHLTYTPAGDVQSVERWLEAAAEPLERRHPVAGRSIAANPPGQSLATGWHPFATYSYDAWGNVIQTSSGRSAGGAPPSCTATVYDGAYEQLPNVVRQFTNGCGSSALDTQAIFDRGLEQVAKTTAPNGGTSEIRFDPFGRPAQVYLPNPDALPGNQATVLAATIAYADAKPLSHIDVRRVVGPGTSTRSVTILNGLGEAVVGFDQGDNNDWILNGWQETNLSGRVVVARRPWAFTGDPVMTAVQATAIPAPLDNSFYEISYDGFGRKASVRNRIGLTGFSLEIVRNRYFPLALESRDAEQLKPGGLHGKAFQRVEFDGRGRTTRAIRQISNPKADTIVTTVKYEPSGEASSIERTHAGSTYQRTMKFDSLGRLMANKEPNTGNNWRYVWDDTGRLVGTSDARGCGVNSHYDGLGRLLGEDYSPCLASHPAYTPPNPSTGAGFESSYVYDAYEAGQVTPEPGFTDDPRSARGHLVAVRDRASHTRFNYDARGRVRRTARQVAKPDGPGTGDPYAPHWFISRQDYDTGDRLTRRTTGVDVTELLVSGSSEERYTYSRRGLPFSIDSSYGSLVKRMSNDADGAPRSIVYGDSRGTTASLAYDLQHRLTMYQLVAPYNGVDPPVDHFDYRYSAYDDAGNPLTIEDRRAPWTPLPPVASPVAKREMRYDDLYRLSRIDSTYKVTGAPWESPFAAEIAAGDLHPVPLRTLPTRVTQQTFDHDGLGNLTASSDNLSARYDRSLGSNLRYGTAADGPNQLRAGSGLQVVYDEAGNLTELKVQRPGNCPTGAADQCAQWFVYDWDEVGQLARARRWDFSGNALPALSPQSLPSKNPSWRLSYAYSQGARVRKSVTDAADVTRHTLEIFDTLRLLGAPFNPADQRYTATRDNVHAYLGGVSHVFWDAGGQLPHQTPGSSITMHLLMGDHLGSSSVVLNHATSELVERTTYQPYGAVESDYRPAKWEGFRESYKFTGKEEDIEVGATYFGARYYQPYLGRFMSADPLTIHGLGSDLNPYAYVAGRVMSSVDPIGLCVPGTITRDPNGTTTEVKDCPAQNNAAHNADVKTAQGEAAASQAASMQAARAVTPKNLIGGTAHIPIPWTNKYFTPNGIRKGAANALMDLLDPMHYGRMIKSVSGDNPLALHIGEDKNDASLIVSAISLTAASIIVGRVGGPPAGGGPTEEAALIGIALDVRNAGGFWARLFQTVAVLRTAEGRYLVGAARDLSPAQRTMVSSAGMIPVRLPGVHAEGTVLEGAMTLRLNPAFMGVSRTICWVCERDIPTYPGAVTSSV